MEVKVVISKWGNFKKGDVIEMHETTAKGCIANKVVEPVKKTAKKAK